MPSNPFEGPSYSYIPNNSPTSSPRPSGTYANLPSSNLGPGPTSSQTESHPLNPFVDTASPTNPFTDSRPSVDMPSQYPSSSSSGNNNHTAGPSRNPPLASQAQSQMSRSQSGGSSAVSYNGGHGNGGSNVGHSRTMSSLGPEDRGVQRGELGAGFGPYAYTNMPSAHSREPLLAGGGFSNAAPLPHRFSSNISEASFDSAYKPQAGVATSSMMGGAGAGHIRHNANSASPQQSMTPVQGTATTATAATGLMAWNDKDDLDDAMHTPDPPGKEGSHFDLWSGRGWLNGLTVFVLLTALITLFAGWPIISYYTDLRKSEGSNTSGYNLGGINSTGQYPSLTNFPSLIDVATPSDVYTRTGFDGNTWDLVFSDEFEVDGRTFFDGDDPYWTAVDLHYWPTGDFEWYDPSAPTTANGKLVIALTEEPIHDLNFKSGMLQSWNKMCFSGSLYLEVSVSLPGTNAVGGFWPGVWTMGNLGRPGYGASTDGTWPYTYDSCDIGTLANQTYANGTGPAAALSDSDGNALSYLPGQRLSACTCSGEDHPGPSTSVGRSAPEIDVLEAQVNVADAIGVVSQSMQLAPFDADYQFANSSSDVEQYNTDITGWNTYLGGVYQQAISSLTNVPNSVYAGTSGAFNTYGFEMYGVSTDRDNSYITWVANGVESWTVKPGAMAANAETEISARLVPEEPMSMIINFGMSNNFQSVDFAQLTFPNYLYVEYVRVYQRPGIGSIGCDPSDHPTADYIAKHEEAYTNANLTTWDAYLETAPQYTWPKNSLIDTC